MLSREILLRKIFVKNRDHCVPDVWLARYAKLVVIATFLVIMIGGHTTTAGAGMAFPDWPLSHGSLNPDRWWADFMQRLEHGHRMAAEGVGLLIGILCAWVWRNKWSLPLALAGSIILAVGARLAHAAPSTIAHIGLWSAALIFAVAILCGRKRASDDQLARGIAFAAFVGVCLQAIMGGLRVTTETAGDSSAAIAFRVLHGCFAQFELCLLVALAAIVSPRWDAARARIDVPLLLRFFSWGAVALIYLQLIIGALMRHNGAGLAIPTFPQASVEGHWLPPVHSALIHLNFAHTRVGALLVTVVLLLTGFGAIRRARGYSFIVGPAALLILLLGVQVALGVVVVWQSRPALLTTLHVLIGAALLGTSVLLAMRLHRATARPSAARTFSSALEEVHA